MVKKDKLLIIPLTIIGINLTLFIVLSGLLLFSFEHPYVSDWGLLSQMCLYCNIPALLAGIYIPLYIILRRWLKKWMKITLTIIVAILILLTFIFSFRFMLLMGFSSPFSSQTEDINNYLKLDGFVEDFSSHDIFPESISASAENIQYFYRYRNIMEEDFDIYLKLSLSKPEFDAEKMRLMQQYPNAEIVEKENGVIDYRIHFEDQRSYYYEFVSFSQEDLTIEYICSYSLEGDAVGDIPYFEEVRKNK